MFGIKYNDADFDIVRENLAGNEKLEHTRGTASILVRGDVGRDSTILCRGGGARVIILGTVHEGALVVCSGGGANLLIEGSVGDEARVAADGGGASLTIKGHMGKAAVESRGGRAKINLSKGANPGAYIKSSNLNAFPKDCPACEAKQQSETQRSPSELFALGNKGGGAVSPNTAALLQEADKGFKRRNNAQQKPAKHNHAMIDWSEIK